MWFGSWVHGAGMRSKKSMEIDASPARQSANGEIVAHSLGEIRSFLDELMHGSRKYRTIASLSGQIAEAYRGRCVLELLQNAHDSLIAAPGGDLGQITFVLETEPAPVLMVANSGRAFERRDFKGYAGSDRAPRIRTGALATRDSVSAASSRWLRRGNLVDRHLGGWPRIRLPLRSAGARAGCRNACGTGGEGTRNLFAVRPVREACRLDRPPTATLSRPVAGGGTRRSEGGDGVPVAL